MKAVTMESGNTNKAEDQAERGGELRRPQDAVVQPYPPASNCGTIYLLHFDTPYKHAKHYLGYTESFEKRIERHLQGHGARLINVIVEAGITFQVARLWKGDRRLERQLKNKKNACKLCPICRGEVK